MGLRDRVHGGDGLVDLRLHGGVLDGVAGDPEGDELRVSVRRDLVVVLDLLDAGYAVSVRVTSLTTALEPGIIGLLGLALDEHELVDAVGVARRRRCGRRDRTRRRRTPAAVSSFVPIAPPPM